MQWYEEVLDRIDDKKIYCHKELMDELRLLKTDLSDSSYHWAISGLVRDGALTRRGYDSYSLSSDHPKDEYVPIYSDTAEGLINLCLPVPSGTGDSECHLQTRQKRFC